MYPINANQAGHGLNQIKGKGRKEKEKGEKRRGREGERGIRKKKGRKGEGRVGKEGERRKGREGGKEPATTNLGIYFKMLPPSVTRKTVFSIVYISYIKLCLFTKLSSQNYYLKG